MYKKLTTLALGLSFIAMSCNERTTTQTKLQYMPDMADAPTVKAQKDYIDPPDSSVAMNAILYPDTPEESEKLLQNPYANNNPEMHAAKGKELFDTFCTVCHGPNAKGKGNITDKYPTPPDLTQEMYVKRGDGFFFHKITFGSAVMPSHGHAISPHERWQIILHLRNLQKVAK